MKRATNEKKEERRKKKKKKRKEAEGNNPRIYARLFDAGTIFKLSASAYDARVKSCGMDFRFPVARETSEKTFWNTWQMRAVAGDPEGEMNQAHPSCRTYIRLTLDLPFGMLTISYVRGWKRIRVFLWKIEEIYFVTINGGKRSWRQL